MKSTLVFWDNKENSKRGTLRGLVILPIYVIITLVWYSLTKQILYNTSVDTVNNFRLIISLIVSGTLIVSAIAVNTPSISITAITYGALVGLVVYGTANSVLLATSKKWGYTLSVVDTLWGIISTSLLSYILYEIVKKWPHIFQTI